MSRENVENKSNTEGILSDRELADVSGGVSEDFNNSIDQEKDRATKPGTSILEPGPTFPDPPRPDDIP